jgi:hypothetical protein
MRSLPWRRGHSASNVALFRASEGLNLTHFRACVLHGEESALLSKGASPGLETSILHIVGF